MSFDLYAIQKSAGAPDTGTARAVLTHSEKRRNEPDTSEAQAWRARTAAAIRSVDPSLEPFTFDHERIARELSIGVEEARTQFRHIELTSPESDSVPLQVTVFDNHVSLLVPYSCTGPRATAMFDRLWKVLEVLSGSCGLFIFDPQSDRIVNVEADRKQTLDGYESVMKQVEAKLPAILAEMKRPPRPWWKFW